MWLFSKVFAFNIFRVASPPSQFPIEFKPDLL
jgi:hypothetical protein